VVDGAKVLGQRAESALLGGDARMLFRDGGEGCRVLSAFTLDGLKRGGILHNQAENFINLPFAREAGF